MRELWVRGSAYAFFVFLTFFSSYKASAKIGVSSEIIATILGVWVFSFAMELVIQANGWFWSKLAHRNSKVNHE